MKGMRPVGLVFLLAVVVYGLNFLFAEGFNGGADSFTHYQISRYSWNYPDLLLDQWGKPVFTILFSPLAQLGFQAVIIGNMALIFVGAWMAFLIAKKLEFKRSHWIPFMVLFTPIVAGNAISGLTEMICALFLIGFILLALNEKFIWGSILLSFMPFARSEGFVIIAVVILFFVLTKRMKYLPYLLVGSVVFNFIGWAITGKPLWIFQSNPYMGSSYDDSYGSGPVFQRREPRVPGGPERRAGRSPLRVRHLRVGHRGGASARQPEPRSCRPPVPRRLRVTRPCGAQPR